LWSLSAAITVLSYNRNPKAGAFVERIDPSTTTEIPAWQAAMAEIRRYDLVSIFSLLLIIIILTALIVAIKKALSRRSFIYLDLASAKGIAQIRFCTLPDPLEISQWPYLKDPQR
jgi:hypothetical protein